MSFEIGKDIATGKSFTLRIEDIVASRTYMASETRFGKSHTARVIVEELLENWVGRVTVVIVDVEGEYSSLREKYEHILIIGRDVPIDILTADLLAEQILQTGFSAIIDLSVLEEDTEAGKEYLNKFLRRFFHLQTTAKKPCLLLWEEIEDFAPESGAPGTRTCFGTAIEYARKGGKRGIGVIFVGHRPAWTSKGILSQCPNKAIGRIEQPDMEALKNYARIPSSFVEKLVQKIDDKTGETINPGPERGVFLFAGDWVQKITFVKVGPVKTTHLGATPEIIPRPIGSMEAIVKRLQQSVSKVVEQTKPITVSKTEIEGKIRTEYENKYKDRIDAVLKTANEKAERKFKVQVEELTVERDKYKVQLQEASRSQTLQPTAAPVKDVLEHPIVKTRMLELNQKARDLLIKIEREPNVTREQLAAFLPASHDKVKRLIELINDTFKATVIVGSSRPVRYKSLLQRLFITDVGRREIDELERLENQVTTLTNDIKNLREKVRIAEAESASLHATMKTMVKPEEYNRIRGLCSDLAEQTQKLKRESDAASKKAKQYYTLLANIGTAIDGVVKTEVAVTPPKEVTQSTQSTPSTKETVQATPMLPVETMPMMKEGTAEQKMNESLPTEARLAIRKGLEAFLEKHLGKSFLRRELSIVVGCDVSDNNFQEAIDDILMLPVIEVTDEGIRRKP